MGDHPHAQISSALGCTQEPDRYIACSWILALPCIVSDEAGEDRDHRRNVLELFRELQRPRVRLRGQTVCPRVQLEKDTAECALQLKLLAKPCPTLRQLGDQCQRLTKLGSRFDHRGTCHRATGCFGPIRDRWPNQPRLGVVMSE